MPAKRHHYVPIWYQKPFCHQVEGKDLIYVYDKDLPDRPRVQQPLNTGVEGKLYSFEGPDGEEVSLEEDFAELEQVVQPIVQRWAQDPRSPTDEETGVMALFVGHMLGRSPRTIGADQETREALYMAMMRNLAKQPERQKFDELKKEGKLPGVENLEDLQRFLDEFEERTTVTASRKYSMAQSVSLGHKMGDLLLRMRWTLVSSPSNEFFITSDCPVAVVHFPEPGKAGFGGGIAHPTAEVCFPLSPEVCLNMNYRNGQRHRKASARTVTEYNRYQAAVADRFVLSPMQTQDIQRMVQRFAHTRAQPKVDREMLIDRFNASWRKTRRKAEPGCSA